jgi:mono/diheme cytochrome c family protein
MKSKLTFMKTAIRAGGFLLGGLCALVAVSGVVVYGYSHLVLTRVYDVPLTGFVAAADSASIQEGERLARIRGCYGGCHGSELQGRVFWDEPGVGSIVAPNLTTVARQYADAELERVIRRGVRQNGRSVLAMPSDMFAGLADDDLRAIIAFIRSRPEVEGIEPRLQVGPIGRYELTTGAWKPVAPGISGAPPTAVPRHDQIEWGLYLARTSCTECHGHDLRGGESAPDLVMAAAFSDEGWEALMTRGEGLAGRELGLMRRVARSRFAYFTPDERAALHAYLRAMSRDATLRPALQD